MDMFTVLRSDFVNSGDLESKFKINLVIWNSSYLKITKPDWRILDINIIGRISYVAAELDFGRQYLQFTCNTSPL